MPEVTLRLDIPAQVTWAQLSAHLDQLGITAKTVPMPGTGKRTGLNCRARRVDMIAKILPFARRASA